MEDEIYKALQKALQDMQRKEIKMAKDRKKRKEAVKVFATRIWEYAQIKDINKRQAEFKYLKDDMDNFAEGL